MILNEDIELVKSQVSMVDIANYYGMRVNRKGFTICPFHNDKHPSMQVFSGYTSKDGFYCRSCGIGGTIFNFAMQYENLTFEESVRKVAAIFEIPITSENELSKDDCKRMVSQRMKGILKAEEQQLEQQEFSYLAETIHLLESVIRSSPPFSELFCTTTNLLPVMQGEWDEKYQSYCDRR